MCMLLLGQYVFWGLFVRGTVPRTKTPGYSRVFVMCVF